MRSAKCLLAIFTMLLGPVAPSGAGSYAEVKDDFTGKTIVLYKSNVADSMRDRLVVVLRDYRASDKTLILMVKGVGGSILCETAETRIQLKSADGTIHRLDAKSFSSPPICVARIPAEWVMGEVTIRATIYGDSLFSDQFRDRQQDTKMDTSDLDMSRIAIEE